MKLSLALLSVLGLVAATTPTRSLFNKRQSDRPCFHAGSAVLCCPESGDELIATNCTTPTNINSTSSSAQFYYACHDESLTAQCCVLAGDGVGVICAPVPTSLSKRSRPLQ